MKTLKMKWTGLNGQIMHNGQLADPLNRYAKEMKRLSSTRKKTDETHEAMARVEWEGSFYFDGKGDPAWPATNVHSCIIAGAKKSKSGVQAKEALIVDGMLPIAFSGPKDLDGMFADGRFIDRRVVKVGMSRVVRTRPFFPEWSISFDLHVDDTIIDPKTVIEWCETAGVQIGLSDYRPKFGRFEVECK